MRTIRLLFAPATGTWWGRPVSEDRRAGIISVCAAILAARKQAAVPRNSPACIFTLTEALADPMKKLEAASTGLLTVAGKLERN